MRYQVIETGGKVTNFSKKREALVFLEEIRKSDPKAILWDTKNNPLSKMFWGLW